MSLDLKKRKEKKKKKKTVGLPKTAEGEKSYRKCCHRYTNTNIGDQAQHKLLGALKRNYN